MIVIGNEGDSINLVPTYNVERGSGHSEGIFAFSSSGGYGTYIGNRFTNSKDAAFGRLSISDKPSIGASSHLIITGNYFRNTKGIFKEYFNTVPATIYEKSGRNLIVGNTFDSCGVNDYSGMNPALFDTMLFASNILVGGTTLTLATWQEDPRSTRSLSFNASLDFPSTPAQTSSELTITVAGAAIGDPVTVAVGAETHVSANAEYSARVSAANTVTIKLNNYSASAIDPLAVNYKGVVFKKF